MSRFVSTVTGPHTRGPNAPLRPEHTSTINITTANGTSINISGSHIQLEVENLPPQDGAVRRRPSFRNMTKELEHSEDEDNRTTVMWEETRRLNPAMKPHPHPPPNKPVNSSPNAIVPVASNISRTRVESMKTNLSARRPSVEDRHTRADKILGTSNEHPSAHHEGSLPQRGSGSADATRGAGARVSSGPAGIRSPEGPPSQFMVPKGPHSPPVVHQHATPQTSAVPIQSVHPLPRSISNPVPIEASVTKEKADVDDNIDDDKDGVSVSSSWRRRSSRFGDTPLQDMIPPIVSTFRRPNLTHLHTSDPVETSTIPRAPSPFERQEIVQSTPAMSVRTINGRRESASIATPTARANDVASRKDDTMSKDDAASKRSDVISKADDVASRVGGESAATSAWKKAPLPPSEVGRTSVVGSTQSWSSTVIERSPGVDGTQTPPENLGSTPASVTKGKYGMHMTKSSNAPTIETPEVVPASRFFNTTVPSSRAPSCGKDDASEAKTGESAWKKTPLPLSESGVSTAATPFVRPTHTPRSNSSEKNRISNIARGPALPEEAGLITSLGWNIASDTPEQHVALEPVPDDNASVRSGSGSHHTGRQSVQQSVSAQQHVEHRVHAPPTDTPSGRSMWKSKLLPNSETASEDGKSSKTIPGIPVPIEFGPPPQSITGRSHKARSIVTPSNASNVDVAEKGPAHPALSHASTPGPFGLKTESLDPLAHPGSIDTAPPAVGRYTPTSPETRSMWANNFPQPSALPLGKIETEFSGLNLGHFNGQPEISSATETPQDDRTTSESQQTAKIVPSAIPEPRINSLTQPLVRSHSSSTSRKIQTPFRPPMPIPSSEPQSAESSPKQPASLTTLYSPPDEAVDGSSPNSLGLFGVGPSESGLSGSGSLKRQASRVGKTGPVAPSTAPDTPRMMALMSVPA